MTKLFAVLFVPAALLAGIGFVSAGNDRAACSVAATACGSESVALAVADKSACDTAQPAATPALFAAGADACDAPQARAIAACDAGKATPDRPRNGLDATAAFAFDTSGFAGGECDDGSCEASAQLTRAGEAPSPFAAACDTDKEDCDKPKDGAGSSISFAFQTADTAGALAGGCDGGACEASAGLTLAAERPLAADEADCDKACCTDAAKTCDTCEKCDTVLRHTMTDIHGDEVELSKYQGQVVLMVNVASECGFTPQYEGLQELHERYADKGLAVLGFPCNQFGGQEPGSEQEIVEFCEANYGVTFDLFAKVDVNGDDAAPLYKQLTSDSAPIEDTGEVSWNFEKFLIDREGQVVGRFRSRVGPTSEAMIEAIEAAL